MNLLGFDLRFGTATTELVPTERVEFWDWLAKSTVPRGTVIQSASPLTTLYLDSNDIQERPAFVAMLLTEKITEAVSDGAVDLAIVDVSANDYILLRDSVLCNLSVALASLCESSSINAVMIVVPRFPAQSSLFWAPFEQLTSGSVFVVTSAGERRELPKKTQTTPKGFAKKLRQFQSQLEPPPNQALSQVLLRRLGHFERPGTDGKFCSRYFFDLSLGVEDLARSFANAIATEVDLGTIELPQVIGSFAPMSPWLHPTALLTADNLGSRISVVDLSNFGPSEWSSLDHTKRILLVTDLIQSGLSIAAVIERVSGLGMNPLPILLSALASNQTTSISVAGMAYAVKSILDVDPGIKPKQECIQCRLGIPYTSIGGDEFFGLKTFDAWEMFHSVPWIEERDVPLNSVSLPNSPDIASVARNYGDYLAYKIEDRLRSVGIGDEVVIVCKDEEGARTILDSLRVRFRNRMSSVFIPSDALAAAVVDTPSGTANLQLIKSEAGRENVLWVRQLSHAANKKVPIVILDEFVASGSSIRGMLKVLEGLDIRVFAAIVVLNRCPSGLDDLTMPLYSLYEVESPRH